MTSKEQCLKEAINRIKYYNTDEPLKIVKVPFYTEEINALCDYFKQPTLSECIKEWEILDYELINDYCSDFHFVKKIENTIYNRPIYHHFVFERINGGRYFAYSSFEKDDNFKNRQYFIISFQEHNLIHKTLKALEEMKDE